MMMWFGKDLGKNFKAVLNVMVPNIIRAAKQGNQKNSHPAYLMRQKRQKERGYIIFFCYHQI